MEDKLKNCSTGNYSTGDWSTGYRSTGDASTGDASTGDWSTGNHSTGDWSTGHRSTGNRSTGDWSTGDYSTGDWSTGHRSTGNWSTGHYSTGHFSTIDYSGFGAFNKPCPVDYWDNCEKPSFIHFNLTIWIPTLEMSEKERKDNSTYATTGGYLKVLTYKEAWKKAWDGAAEEDKDLLYALPNFDKEVFKEISGIDVDFKDIRKITVGEISELLGFKVEIVE